MHLLSSKLEFGLTFGHKNNTFNTKVIGNVQSFNETSFFICFKNTPIVLFELVLGIHKNVNIHTTETPRQLKSKYEWKRFGS